MSSEPVNYSIKKLQADNLDDVARLHQSVYQRAVPGSFFMQKYQTQYTGVAYIGFIAYADTGIPVAFYGVIPCFLQHEGKQVLSAQSADTMTHPDYRGMGLFVELAELTFKLCQQSGIHVIFGFPNQNSLPGFINKLGWQVNDTMDCFLIAASYYNWERGLKKTPVIKQLYAIYTRIILQKHKAEQAGIASSVMHDGFDGIDRTGAYLKYKTYNNTMIIRVQQALVWIKINNGLTIGDMALTTESFDAVMETLLHLARKLGIKEMMFHCSPGTTLHRLFKERYHVVPSFPVIFKEMGSKLPLERMKFTSADIDTF